MDRQEVWERIVTAIEREFTSPEFGDGEFRVAHNDAMASVTVIETWTSQALMLINATGGTFTHGGPMDDALVVQIPIKRV